MTTKQPQYEVSAKILGKTYKAKGKTVLDALGKLEVGNTKGLIVLTVTHGKVSKERILTGSNAMRLFNTRGMSREVSLKNVSLMFEGV